MRKSSGRVRAVLFTGALAACGGQGSDGANGEAPETPGSVSQEERALLATLRYDEDSAPPADPSNRFAEQPAAARFGQALFFDPRLSGPLIEGDNDGSSPTLGVMGEAGKVSCASCHVPGAGFVDTRSPHRQVSLGAEWTLRRAPTLLDIAFQPLYNWDGRRDSTWNQAIGVMESTREFNSGRLFVAQQVFAHFAEPYRELFGELPPLGDSSRFPPLSAEEAGCRERITVDGAVYDCRGKPGDGAEYDGMSESDREAVTRVMVNVAKAMGAYLRQLRCGPGRFDAWLDGDAQALTEAEQRGAALFVGRAGCSRCHSGPRLSDGAFHNVGMSPAPVAVAIIDVNDRGAADGIEQALADPLSTFGPYSDGDRGALPAQIAPEHLGAFRTPTLRCVASQPSFMHTGQLTTLSGVVTFFNRGGDKSGYPGTSEITALGLGDEERADLLAFLGALAGPGPADELELPPSGP